jgi:hypothetical protein
MTEELQTPERNGKIETKLLASLTEGYKPTIPWDFAYMPDGMPLFLLNQNIEFMLWHPVVHSVLEYYKSGIAGAEFWGGADPNNPNNKDGKPISDNPEVAAFCKEQSERFWDRAVPLLQEGYNYGWTSGECQYDDSDGKMRWDTLHPFAPRDVFLLTQKHKPVGVRVKRIEEKGQVDLWMGCDDIPSKAIWYTHNPRYGQHYGRSQLFGAWRPWRRAAWKDGAESVIDGGVYRFAYAGPVIKYPDESYESGPGIPATILDSQGNPIRSARDMARMMGEQGKTGAAVGFPSTKYPQDQGGGDKWEMEWPKQVLNVDPLINYLKQLYDQISYGIGVPPELLQAAETGSGFSGRRIPMEAFLAQQQKIADQMLHLFVTQVLKPLVMWNWGEKVKFEIKVRSLLETKNKQSGGDKQQQPQDGKPGFPPQPADPQKQREAFFSITERIRQIAERAAKRAS